MAYIVNQNSGTDRYKPCLQRFPLPFFDILDRNGINWSGRYSMSKRPMPSVGSNLTSTNIFFAASVFWWVCHHNRLYTILIGMKLETAPFWSMPR